MTKLKDVDPNTPTGRRVIADLKGKLDTNDRNDVISFGKKYGIFKDVPVKPAYTSKKDGGLMEAIEKVKKEDAVKMEAGGDPANPLKGGQKKLDKNKDGKISGEDFEILRNMKFGGPVKPVKMGAGGGVCKGMGIARAGGKFKLR